MLIQTVVIILCGILVSAQGDTTPKKKRWTGLDIEKIKKLNADKQKATNAKYGPCVIMTKEQIEKLEADTAADRPKVLRMVKGIQNEPDAFDWRVTYPEYMSPVGDQGQCGACWAFAYTGMVEALYAKTHKERADPLSKSELVECATSHHSCRGGTFDLAYNYTEAYGLLSEKVYPYRNSEGEVGTCRREDLTKTKVSVVNATYTEEAEHTKKLLYANGPIMVYINAALLSQNADFSIIRKDDDACCPHFQGQGCEYRNNSINHAVVLVGYGVEGGVPYWVARNSWGPTSGKDGYFRIERGTNACGVEKHGFLVETT